MYSLYTFIRIIRIRYESTKAVARRRIWLEMAVTSLRAGRPRSAQPEVGRERELSYERYLRSPNNDPLKRQQSRTNVKRDCASPTVEPEGTANSNGAGAVEPLEGIDGDVPVSSAKSNASVQTENYGRAGGGRRPVMSARFRTASCPENAVQLPQRPKTAAATTSEHYATGMPMGAFIWGRGHQDQASAVLYMGPCLA